jgi:hypothetical protein
MGNAIGISIEDAGIEMSDEADVIKGPLDKQGSML